MIFLSAEDTLKKIIEEGKYHAPKNTPSKSLINTDSWELTKAIREFNENTRDFFQGITNFFYYIAHPTEILKWIATDGFPLVALITSIAIILYIMGWKKGSKIAAGTITVYGIIVCLSYI